MKRFYMFFINYFKVAVICFLDIVNKLWNPFEEVPSHEPSAYPVTLEPLFYADLEARFMQPSGEFWYTIPRPEDAGDTALFQGLATSMKILKNMPIAQQMSFINTLFINGTLIRGYDSTGKPNDTTSNDSATGMLFFFYTALRWGDPGVRMQSAALLRTWMNNVKAHNWALVDLQGNPTQYGTLEDGVMTDPLRMTLLLALLSIVMIYDASFHQDYADLYEMYKPILAYPKVKALWWDTTYDTHRAAIHLHVLYYMTKDDRYRDGLVRLYKISEKEDNAWVNTLCSEGCRDAGIRYEGSIQSRLSTFDFDQRQRGNLENLNDDMPSVNWPQQFPFGLITAVKRSKTALPFYKRGSQDFFWQRSMMSLDEWVGNKKADTYHSGLDFLLCGWLANRLGLFQ